MEVMASSSAAATTIANPSILLVNVKWNKQEFNHIEVDLNDSFTFFNAQLFTLTGVPPERQKLMAKGRLLKSLSDLQQAAAVAAKSAAPSEPLKLVMLGTAEGNELKQPQEKTVFLEDLTPSEQARLLRAKNIEPLPSGIANLGNTCYLASVLQMLRPCHELTAAVREHIMPVNSSGASAVSAAVSAAAGSNGPANRLGLALKDFYVHWENSSQAAQPFFVVHALREAFPQFARRAPPGPGGLGGEGFMQQDAEECMNCLLEVLGGMLPLAKTSASLETLPVRYEKAKNFVEALFGYDMLVRSCKETADAAAEATTVAKKGSQSFPVEEKLEKNIKFTCFFGTLQQPVNTLDEGLKFSLAEERIDLRGGDLSAVGIENEGAAAADAVANALVRSSQFATLPFYFNVHFMRFEWKRAGGHAEKAKVCKSLKFSSTLDLQPFCTEALKEQLRVGRAVLALRRDRAAGDAETTKPSSNNSIGSSSSSASSSICASSENNTSVNICNHNSSASSSSSSSDCTESKETMSMLARNGPEGDCDPGKTQQTSKFEGKANVYPTGFFSLLGVVTHQGRHADSGHYVGWAKKDQREPRVIEREQQEQYQGQQVQTQQQNSTSHTAGKVENTIGKSADRVPLQRRSRAPPDVWLKFDDDKVSEMLWEQIDLAGGRSDYHIAYLLLYRHRLVEATAEEVQTVECMRQADLIELHAHAEQKRRKAGDQKEEVASVSPAIQKGN